MSIKFYVKSIDLIAKLVQGDTRKIKNYNFYPQKEKYKPIYKSSFLPRATPESCGISSLYLDKFYREISEENNLNIHSLLIIKNGKVISSGSYAPFRVDFPHTTHSMCKSITAMAIGILIDERKIKLSDKVISFFPEYNNLLTSKRMKHITIRNLLTMSAGVTFNEIGSAIEENWEKGFFNSSISFDAGTKFLYNSMNSYMLSCIIRKVTNKSLIDFLNEKLFKYMGIKNVYWECCPRGIEKGGWGLNICLEDMAKLGLLYLQKGNWKGKQLISENYINVSTRKHINTPEEFNKYGYGYHLWISGKDGEFQFNGMFGQNVVVIPKNNMVIAVNSGASNFFPNGVLMDIVRKYFIDRKFKYKLDENKEALKKLEFTLNNLNYQNKVPKFEKIPWYKKILKEKEPAKIIDNRVFNIRGKKYKFEKNRVGVLPLFIQCMHNNYTFGISKIKFGFYKNEFSVLIVEGKDSNLIKIGFSKALYCNIKINNEIYTIATLGEFTKNEDNVPVLKLKINFIETTNTRIIKFFFKNNKIKVKFEETPSLYNIFDSLETLILPSTKKDKNPIENIKDREIIRYKLEETIRPCIDGELL